MNEGRYTFRHDNVLQYIAKCLDRKYTFYVDIPGHQTPAGGTIPPNVTVTNLKPDIVIMDKAQKTVTVFELTVPAEHRLEIAHKLKAEKYAHFTENRNFKVSVVPFEIGSHTGYISNDNKTYIHTLHKFCQKNITLKKFKQNLSAISVISSYYVFNCRNYEKWEDMDHIQAPFPNQ